MCKCRPLTFPYFIPTCFHCLVSWCSTGVVLSAVVNGMREVREAGVNYLLHINGQQWRSVWRASLLHIVSKNVTFGAQSEKFIYSSFFIYPLSPPFFPASDASELSPFMAGFHCKCRLSTFFICKLDNLRSDEQTVPILKTFGLYSC